MRSMWRGTIRFSLVSIPVKIYSAIETSEKIQFNQLHRDDFGAIGYDKRCKKCNEVVTNDQITKGYQYEPDRYAIVEPDDLAKIKIKTTKAVDIVGFVAREEIPTTFYDAPYFAGPDGPISENPYALLRSDEADWQDRDSKSRAARSGGPRRTVSPRRWPRNSKTPLPSRTSENGRCT